MSYRYKCQYHSRQAENHTDSLTVITLDELLVGRLIPEELERVKKLFQIIITDGIAGSTTFCKGNAAAVSFQCGAVIQNVGTPTSESAHATATAATAFVMGEMTGAAATTSEGRVIGFNDEHGDAVLVIQNTDETEIHPVVRYAT